MSLYNPVVLALETLAVGKQWALTGRPTTEAEYNDALQWLDDGAAPTWAEISATFK